MLGKRIALLGSYREVYTRPLSVTVYAIKKPHARTHTPRAVTTVFWAVDAMVKYARANHAKANYARASYVKEPRKSTRR